MPSSRRDCPRFELAPDHVAVLGRFDSKKALYLALLAKHAEQLPRSVDPTVGDEPLAARLPGAVLAELLRAQPELSIPDEEVEPTAELLRSAMAGLALWWLDHPKVPRPVLVDLVTRTIRGLLQPLR
jgi:hypothetical protein